MGLVSINKVFQRPRPEMFMRQLVFALCACSSMALLAQPQVLNFNQAEIQSVIATMGEITGKTFVIDPRVQGQVTVISSKPLQPDEMYGVFLNVLQVHGYAAIEDGSVVRIVPDAVARQQSGSNQNNSMGGENIVTQILPLSNITASEALPLLRPLLPQGAHLVAHDASNTLIAADRASNIERLRSIIARIDKAEQSEVEIMRLEHASATSLLRIIDEMNSSGTSKVLADERTNSLLLSGDPAGRLRLRTLVSHLDTPLDQGGNTQVVHLNYADAQEMVPILQGLVEQQAASAEPAQGSAAGSGMQPRIQAHQQTNSLIISAQPDQLRSMKNVIRSLDIPRAQVLVEAIIAEVTIDTSRELGIQWQATGSLNPILGPDGEVIGLDSGFLGGTNFGTGGNNIINQTFFNPDNLALPSNGLNIGYLSGTTSILGTEVLELGVVLRALSSDSNSNILSTPSIVTMDNAEASISVGQEVPFITGSFTNTSVDAADGQVNPFQTINREEVGILLKVTPKINEGDAVILTISQEVSALLGQAAGASDLITSKRTLSTQVMVHDNDVLVLGGLITDDVMEVEDRVPGLGDVPVLGYLFKTRSNRKVKRNLMVFIRPRILRDRDLSNAISAGKYEFMRASQMDMRDRAQGLSPSDEMPLLPELYQYLQSTPEQVQPQESGGSD